MSGERSRLGEYSWDHRRLRAGLRPAVESGQVVCARCGELILPWELWDLGHDDHDRSQYSGPEHRRCNRFIVGDG